MAGNVLCPRCIRPDERVRGCASGQLLLPCSRCNSPTAGRLVDLRRKPYPPLVLHLLTATDPPTVRCGTKNVCISATSEPLHVTCPRCERLIARDAQLDLTLEAPHVR